MNRYHAMHWMIASATVQSTWGFGVDMVPTRHFSCALRRLFKFKYIYTPPQNFGISPLKCVTLCNKCFFSLLQLCSKSMCTNLVFNFGCLLFAYVSSHFSQPEHRYIPLLGFDNGITTLLNIWCLIIRSSAGTLSYFSLVPWGRLTWTCTAWFVRRVSPFSTAGLL